MNVELDSAEKIINRFLTSASLLLFLGLISLEIVVFFYPSLGSVGMYFWLVSLILFALISVKSFLLLCKNSFKNRSFYTIASILVMMTLFFVYSRQSAHISFETTQEAACAIFYWTQAPDRGFHQACFLGYPSRQYLLMVIPTLLFGPSLLALNLGGSLYFIFGLFLWACGLKIFLKEKIKSKSADILAAISVVLLLHFHYFNHFLLHAYEQSQFPLSLSLAFWGVYLWRLAKPEKWHLPVLGLILLFLAQAYTPAIAFLGLAVLLVAGLALAEKSKKSDKIIWAAVAVGAMASLAVTFTFRQDVKLVGSNNQSLSRLTEESSLIFRHLFIETQGHIEYGSILGRLVLFAAFLSPIFLGLKKFALLPFWIIATLLIATISQGYSYYHLNFRIHRSIVVLPTVILLVVLLINKLELKIKNSPLILISLWLVTLIWGIGYANSYLQTKSTSQHYLLIKQLQHQVADLEHKEMIVFSDKANQQFISLNDSLTYFLPQLQKKEFRSPINTHLGTTWDEKAIVILDKNHDNFWTTGTYFSDEHQAGEQKLYILH